MFWLSFAVLRMTTSVFFSIGRAKATTELKTPKPIVHCGISVGVLGKLEF